MLDRMNSLRLLAATTDAEPTGWSVDQTVSYLQQHGMEFLLNLVTAVVIFFVGRWVARLLTGIVRRVMDRAKVDEALARFLANILYVAMLVFVVMAAPRTAGRIDDLVCRDRGCGRARRRPRVAGFPQELRRRGDDHPLQAVHDRQLRGGCW